MTVFFVPGVPKGRGRAGLRTPCRELRLSDPLTYREDSRGPLDT